MVMITTPLLCLLASEVANKLNTRRPVHQHFVPPSGGLLEDLLFPLLTVRFKGDTFFCTIFAGTWTGARWGEEREGAKAAKVAKGRREGGKEGRSNLVVGGGSCLPFSGVQTVVPKTGKSN